jgi:hypothetical protein
MNTRYHQVNSLLIAFYNIIIYVDFDRYKYINKSQSNLPLFSLNNNLLQYISECIAYIILSFYFDAEEGDYFFMIYTLILLIIYNNYIII